MPELHSTSAGLPLTVRRRTVVEVRPVWLLLLAGLAGLLAWRATSSRRAASRPDAGPYDAGRPGQGDAASAAASAAEVEAIRAAAGGAGERPLP
ncbi:MAG: hypothetical protein JWM64_1402 [Frankiales bacterium]|nr:hypothetical protein [Frankiales bacterium]